MTRQPSLSVMKGMSDELDYRPKGVNSVCMQQFE